MKKKLVALLLVIALVRVGFCVAGAEIYTDDLSKMSDEDLVLLKNAVETEFIRRTANPSTIGSGTYIGGKTIKSGTYVVICSLVSDESGSCIVVRNAERKTISSSFSIALNAEYTFTVSDGDQLIIDGASFDIVPLEQLNKNWAP